MDRVAPLSIVIGPLNLPVKGEPLSAVVVVPVLTFKGALNIDPFFNHTFTIPCVWNVPEPATVDPLLEKNDPDPKVKVFVLGFSIPPPLIVKEDEGLNFMLLSKVIFPELPIEMVLLEKTPVPEIVEMESIEKLLIVIDPLFMRLGPRSLNSGPPVPLIVPLLITLSLAMTV